MNQPAPRQARSGDNQKHRIVSIGSDPGNDICMAGLFPFHVRVLCEPDGCLIEDLTLEQAGFAQTFLAPADNPTERIPIVTAKTTTYDDVVYLGVHQFPLSRLRPAAPSHPQPRYKHDSSRASVGSASGSVIRVGADSSNRLVVEAPSVNAFHAEFKIEKDKCWVRDPGTNNGTFLVDRNEPTSTKRIESGVWTKLSFSDSVLLGSYRFPLSRLLDIKDFPIEKGKQIYIGRSPDNNNCVLDLPSVSSHHARFLFRKNGEVLVEDLASLGGTFINSERVAPYTPHVLRERDRVKISSYDLYIDPVSKDHIRVDFSGNIKLDIQNLSCDIGDKRVLRDISFSAKPGEFVGILGPSGHGKSVLLECLIRKHSFQVRGDVWINGKALWQYWDSFQEQIGYVPQGEVLPLQLSVEQILRYAARLWIRSDLRESEVDKQIGDVLDQLNMSHARRQQLRVLSGGELRRVNIAYELIRSPNLLFLDEPTTGLSTKDARIVMSSLRELANAGHTIISIIHQPSRDIYSFFNLVAVLFEGRILYYGPPQLSYDYFKSSGSHPEDVFEALERYESKLESQPERREELLDEWVKLFQESQEYDEYVKRRIKCPAIGSYR